MLILQLGQWAIKIWKKNVISWAIHAYLYTFLGTCMHAKSLQSCPTLCNTMDCSPPGSFVHGISQARILEWVAIEIGELYRYYLKKLLGPGIPWRTKLSCLAVSPPPNPALTQLSLTTLRLWSKQTVTSRSSPVIPSSYLYNASAANLRTN